VNGSKTRALDGAAGGGFVPVERIASGIPDCLHALDLLDEYQDRIITGFDILDLTLRELPQLNLKTST
jgi:hypothetical protein